MAEHKPQTLENHVRLVPAFHMVAFPILAINLVWWAYTAITAPSFAAILQTAVAVALLIVFFYARVFAVTVQDRVIRLEMRLRLGQVLPPDLKARVNDFTLDQLCALRFASDAELPDLARKVLAEHVNNRKAIKQMVKQWQGDYLRA